MLGVGGGLGIVQIEEHRGRLRGREQQILELAPDARADDVPLEGSDEDPVEALAGEDVEVVHPEVHEDFIQLPLRQRRPDDPRLRELFDDAARAFFRRDLLADLLLRSLSLLLRSSSFGGRGRERRALRSLGEGGAGMRGLRARHVSACALPRLAKRPLEVVEQLALRHGEGRQALQLGPDRRVCDPFRLQLALDVRGNAHFQHAIHVAWPGAEGEAVQDMEGLLAGGHRRLFARGGKDRCARRDQKRRREGRHEDAAETDRHFHLEGLDEWRQSEITSDKILNAWNFAGVKRDGLRTPGRKAWMREALVARFRCLN